MITDRIGRHEVLLSINQTVTKSEKSNRANDAGTVQLPVHCPINAQIGPADNQSDLRIFCYSFDKA